MAASGTRTDDRGQLLGLFFVGGTSSQPGVNLPRSKLGANAGWEIINRPTTSGLMIYGKSGNMFLVGTNDNANANLWDAILKPEDAWNLDTKLDDGRPARGSMLSGNDSGTCITPSTADYGVAAAGNTAANYNLAINSKDCRLWFLIR